MTTDNTQKPMAWMTEDGLRVATDNTKQTGMANASKPVFCVPLYTAPQPVIAPNQPVAISDEERAALVRFCETCEDDEGYDVPKVMIQKLAAIGLVSHSTRGTYTLTFFGASVLRTEQLIIAPKWVGLTDNEIKPLWDACMSGTNTGYKDFARAIEAAFIAKQGGAA